MITVGSDFSGVGAFNQALNRLGIDYEEVKQMLIECCSEVSCEDGVLVGKSSAELVKWIDTKFKKK